MIEKRIFSFGLFGSVRSPVNANCYWSLSYLFKSDGEKWRYRCCLGSGHPPLLSISLFVINATWCQHCIGNPRVVDIYNETFLNIEQPWLLFVLGVVLILQQALTGHCSSDVPLLSFLSWASSLELSLELSLGLSLELSRALSLALSWALFIYRKLKISFRKYTYSDNGWILHSMRGLGGREWTPDMGNRL